jgi:uncharacterized cupin superfamily protein
VIVNLAELELRADDGLPEGHRFVERSLTEEVGATLTGLAVYELPPGEATWPYHFELIEEEWLIVIAGEVVLRTPEGERTVRMGDAACFPSGPAGAHAVRNDGREVARFAMPSSVAPYGDGAVYPDSGTFTISAPGGFRHRARLGEPVEYWQGET